MKPLLAALNDLPEFRQLCAAVDNGACPAAVNGLSAVHRAHFAAGLRQALGRPVRRAELAVHLLAALDEMYAAFPQGKNEYLAEYRRRCVTTGHEVALVGPGGSREPAFAKEVDDDFSLVCRLPDGSERTVTAGEVSVRGLLGYV